MNPKGAWPAASFMMCAAWKGLRLRVLSSFGSGVALQEYGLCLHAHRRGAGSWPACVS